MNPTAMSLCHGHVPRGRVVKRSSVYSTKEAAGVDDSETQQQDGPGAASLANTNDGGMSLLMQMLNLFRGRSWVSVGVDLQGARGRAFRRGCFDESGKANEGCPPIAITIAERRLLSGSFGDASY
jgi:hypothetical protein